MTGAGGPGIVAVVRFGRAGLQLGPPIPLPAGAAFLGVSLYGQILAIEVGANPANLVTSRPLGVTTGW